MKIKHETTVNSEDFTLVTTTRAVVMGKAFEHTEVTDLTDLYVLFLDRLIEDGWLEAEDE